MAEFYFLPADYAALQGHVAEAEERKKEALASIGQVIEQTSGTWHDNPAFDFAQEQSRMWSDEVRKRTAILTQAKVVHPTRQTRKVAIGSRVTYRNEAQGFVDEIIVGSYLNLGPNRGNDDVISYATPVGMAIMDHKVGDTVQVVRPDGRFSVTILRIAVA
jgi:transcription elongation factor GreA